MIFDYQIFDFTIFDTDFIPVTAPIDWAPALQADESGIVAQAMRFMQLPPITRYAPDAELRASMAEAFALSIEECLASSDWTFASVLARLPGTTEAPDEADTFTTALALPGDCVAVREVRPQGSVWRIDGLTLLVDQPAPVTIRYTARVTREDVLPAGFKLAAALFIAARLGARWSGGGIAPDELSAFADRTLKQARKDDGVQSAAARILAAPDLGYGDASDDWALEAVA